MNEASDRAYTYNLPYRPYTIPDYNNTPILTSRTVTTPPKPTMKRLLNFNDWTIALNGNTLLAFNSVGRSICSDEGKICLDGTAFLYKEGLLWKGKLQQVLTELNIADAKIHAEYQARVRNNDLIERKIESLREGIK